MRVTGLRQTVLRPAHAAASREGLQHGLSGEALSMFHDAQRNILELNKSRLMALDELKQAKERINELESKCAQYENSLGQRVSSPVSRTRRSGAITIAYSTGWSEAYIHYQRGDGSWTEAPGQKMDTDPSKPGLFVVHLPESATEFVFNNGDNDWDSPWDSQNYVITEPGEFLVQSGEVSKLTG